MRIAARHAVKKPNALLKKSLPALPIAQPFKPRAAEHSAPRRQSFANSFDRRPGAEGKSAEVEFGEFEMPDELTQIPRKNAARIMLGFVRLAAEAMHSKVGH